MAQFESIKDGKWRLGSTLISEGRCLLRLRYDTIDSNGQTHLAATCFRLERIDDGAIVVSRRAESCSSNEPDKWKSAVGTVSFPRNTEWQFAVYL